LKQEFREEKIAYDEKIKQLSQDLIALEKRYRDRESRPEDIEKIKNLENEMIEKARIVCIGRIAPNKGIPHTKESVTKITNASLGRSNSYGGAKYIPFIDKKGRTHSLKSSYEIAFENTKNHYNIDSSGIINTTFKYPNSYYDVTGKIKIPPTIYFHLDDKVFKYESI
jgi:hypothetical protein